MIASAVRWTGIVCLSLAAHLVLIFALPYTYVHPEPKLPATVRIENRANLFARAKAIQPDRTNAAKIVQHSRAVRVTAAAADLKQAKPLIRSHSASQSAVRQKAVVTDTTGNSIRSEQHKLPVADASGKVVSPGRLAGIIRLSETTRTAVLSKPASVKSEPANRYLASGAVVLQRLDSASRPDSRAGALAKQISPDQSAEPITQRSRSDRVSTRAQFKSPVPLAPTGRGRKVAAAPADPHSPALRASRSSNQNVARQAGQNALQPPVTTQNLAKTPDRQDGTALARKSASEQTQIAKIGPPAAAPAARQDSRPQRALVPNPGIRPNRTLPPAKVANPPSVATKVTGALKVAQVIRRSKSLPEIIKEQFDKLMAESCYFAELSVNTNGLPSLLGFGNETIPIARFYRAVFRQTGVEPAVELRKTTQSQCAAIDFISAILAGSQRQLPIELEQRTLNSGERISGTVSKLVFAFTLLLLIDDDGRVHDVTSYIEKGPDWSQHRFSIPVFTTGDGAQHLQLLLAVNTDVKITKTAGDGQLHSDDYFAGLQQLFNANSASVRLGLRALRVK